MKYAAPPYLQSCERGSQFRETERKTLLGGRYAVSEMRTGLERTGGGSMNGKVDGVIDVILTWVHGFRLYVEIDGNSRSIWRDENLELVDTRMMMMMMVMGLWRRV